MYREQVDDNTVRKVFDSEWLCIKNRLMAVLCVKYSTWNDCV